MANTANILAGYRREADTSSAEAGRNSAAAHREHTATGAAKTGVAVIGAAIGGIIDSSATDPSLSADLVIRTTGIGTHIGAGAILTRTRTTAIILMGIILRMGTIMIIRFPAQRLRLQRANDLRCGRASRRQSAVHCACG